jgi:pilus assembly protein Flp/PilA
LATLTAILARGLRGGLQNVRLLKGPTTERPSMKQMLARFLADESGATSIEYALMAASIALVIIPGVNGLGRQLSTKFTAVTTALH